MTRRDFGKPALNDRFGTEFSDEFTAKTGFGVYAHITPMDVNQAYHQYQLRNAPMRLFVREYVRHYI